MNFLTRIFNRRLRSDLSILKKAYEQTPLEIAIYDLNHKFIFLNNQFYTGELESDFFIHHDDLFYCYNMKIDSSLLDKRNESFKQALETRKPVSFTEKYFFPQSGKTLFFKRSYRPLFLNGPDEVSHIAFFGNNITAIILSQKELKYLAFHDKLTGLGNRDAFNQQVEQLITEADRAPEGQYSAVLFCDLDNFKLVNDSLGHDIGDLILLEVANRLKNTLRAADTIFRLGGDEFTILLKNLKKDVDAGTVAEKLINTISQPYTIREHTINYLTISIGIALYPRDGKDREALTSNADLAMYEAKKHSKNNFKYFSKELTQSSKDRLKIVKNLKEMIHQKDFEKQFQIVYQPIFEKNNGANYSIVGSEALLRWQNPQIGVVSPNLFIPVAEESNLIQHFGEWVLDRSLRDFKQINNHFSNRPLYVSINLSAKQLGTPGLIQNLERMVRESGLNPQQIQLELTETSIIDDGKLALRNLSLLAEMGFRLAIDDFGVGFASLSYLQKIPATVIKIDRSFITHAHSSRKNADLVKAIISLARNLDKDVIAEGVEQQSHLDFLIKNKCFKYQGYFFSRPLDLDAFEDKLRDE